MLAPLFFGRYEHSLDLKGRVVLPAKLRLHFDSAGYLTTNLEGCLALWTPEEFSKKVEEHRLAQDTSAEARNTARLWAASTTDVEIDRQGRLAIPQHLKDFARLDRNVLVVGAIQRVEIWAPERWAGKVEPYEAGVSDPPDGAGPPSAAVSPPSAAPPSPSPSPAPSAG